MLRGLRVYQAHPHVRTAPPMPVVARAGGAVLRDYGGDGPAVVFVPSLINPPVVLDLAEDNSMLRWLAQQGVRPLLVDWGTPGADEARLDLAGYVEARLLPLLAALAEPPALVGYCLGGTMALAATALAPAARVALIAAPWRFAGFEPAQRQAAAALWTGAKPLAEQLGGFPMALLQPLFWYLDPAAPAAKFTRLAALDPASAAAKTFVAVEDWANDGPPLTLPAARALFEDLFAADLPGRGAWRVGGRAIDPAALGIPLLDIVSRRDRIVPAAAAAGVGRRIELDLGHVGMVVGGQARAALWEPLADWLKAAD